jgi:hypothetical protein
MPIMEEHVALSQTRSVMAHSASLDNKDRFQDTMQRNVHDTLDGNNSKRKTSRARNRSTAINIGASFQECADSCSAPRTLETVSSDGDIAVEVSEKPFCCEDGVSAIKATFWGTHSTTLFVPTNGAVNGFTVVDMCNREGARHADLFAVKFADCDLCFPGGERLDCSLGEVWDYITVDHGDEVCLISLDGRLPVEVVLYYQGDNDSTNVFPLNLHTSCSKPIYAPYAIKLGACPGDDDLYINLDAVSPNEVDDKLAEASFLKFVDGVGAEDLTLFSDCGVDDEEEITTCCTGGSSFLRTELGGTNLSGFLTFDRDIAAMFCSCVDETSSDSSEDSNLSMPARFVACTDPCRINPLIDEACSLAFDVMNIEPGDEVCFGTWNQATNRIAYREKMPTSLDIYFIPNEGSVSVYTGRIDTSCSKPLHSPFAQALGNACSARPALVNLEESDEEDLDIHLAFVDGMSSVYYEAASEFGTEDSLQFDISFAGCGCSCGQTAVPPLSLVPTTSPSIVLSSAPSDGPTVHPTTLEPSSLEPECEEALQCRDWALEFCVIEGTDFPCDVENLPHRLLLQYQTAVGEAKKKAMSPSEKLAFHKEMASLLQTLASLLE